MNYMISGSFNTGDKWEDKADNFRGLQRKIEELLDDSTIDHESVRVNTNDTYVVIIGMFYDEETDNIFHRAKIICPTTGKCSFSPIRHGTDYFDTARSYISVMMLSKPFKMIFGGVFMVVSECVKKGWF